MQKLVADTASKGVPLVLAVKGTQIKAGPMV